MMKTKIKSLHGARFRICAHFERINFNEQPYSQLLHSSFSQPPSADFPFTAPKAMAFFKRKLALNCLSFLQSVFLPSTFARHSIFKTSLHEGAALKNLVVLLVVISDESCFVHTNV